MNRLTQVMAGRSQKSGFGGVRLFGIMTRGFGLAHQLEILKAQFNSGVCGQRTVARLGYQHAHIHHRYHAEGAVSRVAKQSQLGCCQAHQGN